MCVSLTSIYFDLLYLDVIIFKPVCFLHVLFMTCPFFVDGENQAAVIFLSQHSIPLEQQTMIPLFDENTDEVNINFIKIILWREFLS